MPTIHSFLTEDQAYTTWDAAGPHNVVQGSVLVKGTHGQTFHHGVPTEISEEQMALLKQCSGFNQHRENGLVFVAESVASDPTPDLDSESKSSNEEP